MFVDWFVNFQSRGYIDTGICSHICLSETLIYDIRKNAPAWSHSILIRVEIYNGSHVHCSHPGWIVQGGSIINLATFVDQQSHDGLISLTKDSYRGIHRRAVQHIIIIQHQNVMGLISVVANNNSGILLLVADNNGSGKKSYDGGMQAI